MRNQIYVIVLTKCESQNVLRDALSSNKDSHFIEIIYIYEYIEGEREGEALFRIRTLVCTYRI